MNLLAEGDRVQADLESPKRTEKIDLDHRQQSGKEAMKDQARQRYMESRGKA